MAERLRELRQQYAEVKKHYHERRLKMDAAEREQISAELDELRRRIIAEEEGDRG